MLATPSADLPPDPERYAFEFKWDGIRAIAFVEDGSVRLQSRNLLDLTPQYPELQALGAATAGQQMVLDGEVVAFGPDGRPSFQALQQRGKVPGASVTYLVFDLLFLNGHSTMALPLTARRKLLEGLELKGATWATPPSVAGEGQAMLDASRAQQLEGIVAKRLDSTYQPGVRSAAWLKVKNQLRQEFVIGGWTRGEGNRAGTLGALLVGYYDRREWEGPQRLVFAGKVGTGFTAQFLADLMLQLAALARTESPFEVGTLPRGATFVEPRLVGEVEFTEWTHDRTLRHPSFKGMRFDKDARDVVLETPMRERPS
jgi:bifunctional non-homologous end joining protein LigD